MLTAAQFQQWCLRLHLELAASEAVTRVRYCLNLITLSCRSCMMVLRARVRRQQRFPQSMFTETERE